MLATAVKDVKIEDKTCVQCGETKPISEFEVNRRKCKKCLTAQRKAIKEKKKEEMEKEKPKDFDISNEIPSELNVSTKPKKEIKEEEKIKKAQDSLFKENIKMFLSIGFGVVANRAGDHWNITEKEAENIANPLTNIMSKLQYVEQIAQNMDYINLASALVGTIAPRTIKTIQENKIKKGGKDVGRIKPRKEAVDGNIKGNNSDNGNPKEQNKTNSYTFRQDDETELYNEQLLQELL